MKKIFQKISVYSAIFIFLLFTKTVYARDVSFELFLLNEEQTRIILAIEELKYQLTYIDNDHYELVTEEIKEQLDLLSENILQQIELQKLLNDQ